MKRAPRLAMMLLPGLDHFTADILARLPAASGWEVRPFRVTSQATLADALAWLDDPGRDAIWFEFCWPPFPQWIAATDFGGRRVIVRVHGIEAKEAPHVSYTAWAKVKDLIVVSDDMARRVLNHAPEIAVTTDLHVVSNGVDISKFCKNREWDPYVIGWCGNMTLRKNPMLSLHILRSLLDHDSRYRLRMCGMEADPVTTEFFVFLRRKLGLDGFVEWSGALQKNDMPDWHAGNGLLLHTSLHESFGYAIAEAAASGCDLAVYDHPGASEHWPDSILFGTVDEAVSLICSARPCLWREYIRSNFAVEKQICSLKSLLENRDQFEPLAKLPDRYAVRNS